MEAEGWRVRVVRGSPHEIEIATPSGHTYRPQAPPLLGWGTDTPGADRQGAAAPAPAGSVLERHLEHELEAT